MTDSVLILIFFLLNCGPFLLLLGRVSLEDHVNHVLYVLLLAVCVCFFFISF